MFGWVVFKWEGRSEDYFFRALPATSEPPPGAGRSPEESRQGCAVQWVGTKAGPISVLPAGTGSPRRLPALERAGFSTLESGPAPARRQRPLPPRGAERMLARLRLSQGQMPKKKDLLTAAGRCGSGPCGFGRGIARAARDWW